MILYVRTELLLNTVKYSVDLLKNLNKNALKEKEYDAYLDNDDLLLDSSSYV